MSGLCVQGAAGVALHLARPQVRHIPGSPDPAGPQPGHEHGQDGQLPSPPGHRGKLFKNEHACLVVEKKKKNLFLSCKLEVPTVPCVKMAYAH